jgi:hypothetical protein
MSNVAKPMKDEFFPEVRLKGRMIILINMPREDGHYLKLG